MSKNTIKTITYVNFAVSVAALAVSAHAQTPPTPPNAGSILRDQQRPTLELPRPAPSIRVDEPVRPALERSTVTRFTLTRVRITGNTVFSEAQLLELVRGAVNREVGFTELDELTARISRFYRDRGYLVARAYLPAQKIEGGVVEITVIEGRFGRVTLNNASRVRDGVIRQHIEGLPGAVVSTQNAERKLLLLNDLAGVAEARANLAPGAAVGESDLTVQVTPAPLFSGSVELDNAGNRHTGANRLTGRLNIASPLGLGDALNVAYTHGFEGLDHGRVAYHLPLGGDGFKLGAAYASTRYQIGGLFDRLPVPLQASGEAQSYTLSASYPLLRSGSANLYAQIAYEQRDFQDRIASATSVSDKATRAVALTLNGDARDNLLAGGVTVFAVSHTTGTLDIQTPATLAVDNASARSNGHYGKWSVNLLRLQNLGGGWSALFSSSTQLAGKNLDSSEKFVLGGMSGVRAYPQGEASGDSGYVASLEVRYTMALNGLPGTLQPFVFADAGSVSINRNPFAAVANSRHLAGAGLGVTWSRANDFQVRFMIASRIGHQASTASDTDRHVRGWVQIAKQF